MNKYIIYELEQLEKITGYSLQHIKNDINDVYNKLEEKDKENNRLNNIIDELKQKNNLAENILYDYLYNDGKITKEKYEQFKGLKEGK